MSTVPSANRRLASDGVDGLILGAAVALPWSTSAASVFIVLAILLLPFSTRVRGVALELTGGPGGLPAALVALAAVGMFWSPAAWPENLGAWDSYCKLLLIPPLLVHFRRSRNGPAHHGRLPCLVQHPAPRLLDDHCRGPCSLSSASPPGLGVPVKSPGTQVREFLLSAVALLFLATAALGTQSRSLAGAMLAVSLAFFVSALYMASFLHVAGDSDHAYRSGPRTRLAFPAIETCNQRRSISRHSDRSFGPPCLGSISGSQWNGRAFSLSAATTAPWQGGRGEFWQQSVDFISQAPRRWTWHGFDPGPVQEREIGRQP